MPRFLTLLKRFTDDQHGSVLIFTVMALMVMLSLGVATIDIARLGTVHTQRQQAADAVALAAARELDTLDGARARALQAAALRLGNMQDLLPEETEIAITTRSCGVDGAATTGCIRFLSSLPSSDSMAIDASNLATGDSDSRFVEVRLPTRSVSGFFVGLFSETAAANLTVAAVAGNDPLLCQMPPMFMCSPDPSGSIADFAGVAIQSYMVGPGGTYTGGNFGLLCPAGTDGDPTNCGGSGVSRSLGNTQGTCIRLRQLTTKTGATLGPVRTGINPRVDMYGPQAKDGGGQKWRDMPEFRPAANVTKGTEEPKASGTQCFGDTDPVDAAPLPLDDCMPGCGRIGDGNWTTGKQHYLDINHGGDGSALTAAAGGAISSRYEMYRAELKLDSMVTPGQPTALGGTTTEEGRPSCYTGGSVTDAWDYFSDPKGINSVEILKDRRVFPLAIADCSVLASGKTSFTPIEYGLAFLLQGMEFPSASGGGGGGDSIHIEILGKLDRDAKDVMLRDVVQIYRR